MSLPHGVTVHIPLSPAGAGLLTIRLRLVVASVDRALQMGIRRWRSDAAPPGRQSLREQLSGFHDIPAEAA